MKTYIIKSLMVLILSLSYFPALCYANTIKYYKSYSIDDWDYSVIGKDSLSENEALETVCNKFVYDSTGALLRIEGFGYGLNFYDSREQVAKILFEYGNNTITKKFYDQNNNPMPNQKYRVYGELIIKHKNGYQRYFLDDKGKRTTNYIQVYFISYQIDRANKLITKQYFGENNRPIKNRIGAYKIQQRYNNQHQLIEVRCLDKNDKLMINNLNYALVKYRYGRKNRYVEKRFFDDKGRLAATYPFKTSIIKKTGNREKYFNDKNEAIEVVYVTRFQSGEPDPINYNIVVKLNTSDFLLNIISLTFQSLNLFAHPIKVDKSSIDSLVTVYYRRWHAKLDSLKDQGKIFRQGRAFYLYSSTGNEIELTEKLMLAPEDSLESKLRKLFLLTDITSYERLEKYSDPAARFCYGQLKVNEIVFFQWQDILFVVNPYFERKGGGSQYDIQKIAIDFEKIPISDKINHVFFEGVTVNNYNPRAYFGDVKFYFTYCVINCGATQYYIKYFAKPKEVAERQLIFYKNSEFTFSGCTIDTLALYMWIGDSKWPKRHYPSFTYHFYQSDIKSSVIRAGIYHATPITQPIEVNINFIRCNIDKMDIAGTFTSLIFDNSKIRDFYGTYVSRIEREMKLMNSSFESPLNFPYLTLPDTATFQMINTSYQGYMKFPWQQLKDKIHISTKKDRLKTYGNLYNLLKSNYKTLSLIKDADESYFYWKEFERKNFWKYYWQEPDTRWYNPFHIAKAIGLMIFNHVNYYSCGYGVKPLWIFPFTIFIVGFFALIYFFMPTRISNLEEHLIGKDKITNKLRKMSMKEIKETFKNDEFNFKIRKQSLIEDIISSIGTNELLDKLNLKPKSRYNLDFFWYCVYFSFSTFTTIGIGDWYPAGKLNKALVMLEGALGWLCLGLFITTYANILLR